MVEIHVQVEIYRMVLTSFWIRLGWPHVVEIHVHTGRVLQGGANIILD